MLNLAVNNLFAEGIKLLAAALKNNQIMTELNVSGNAGTWDGNNFGEMSGVIALADAIPNMEALSQFIFSGDENDNTVTMQTSMTDADFSGQGLGVSGAIMVAAFLPKCM